ncbi:Nucleolar pre-ribosomal-associated protein 1, N-terminal [Sesbania bispinosa]|nr:Nucleolar pre-ribosomal-associated protein 1, N-terminal [Sesbania bispinosa]
MEAEAAGGGGGSAMLNLQLKVSHEAKLKELLHRITSVEIKLCSDATKEFVKLLKGEDGGELLREYLRGSPKCSELLEAWKLRQGKQGMHYIFQLISTILSHREGKHTSNLDKFARLLFAEYLNDVYKELNSKEVKRQKAALSLAASIVRRGSSVASEVAKSFDFKLGGFSALAAAKKRRDGEGRGEGLLRKSFVGFAMSFLEVGKPGLLRWVLQQREMYSGVLRGLVNDDEETVVFVLSTLRDRVLVKESLVPPGLRSVLFGSVTLEQLVEVCGREGGGAAAELAFEVLVMVCTDPSNGLMPDLKKRPNPLRGNPKRIMGLMKKLWATDFQYHRDLLLAIVNARPSFGLSYLKEFPYNIENYKLSSWVSAISLAADLVSSVSNGLSKEFINSRSNDPHSFDNMDLHNIVKCLFPRPFSRSMFNKGLHHTDSYVKHGTLRLLLELLKLLDSPFGGLDHNSSSSNPFMQHVLSVKQEIQNYVQAFLPDLQVLFNLLSSLDACSEAHNSSLKRNACNYEHNSNSRKKLKMDTSESDTDIIVGGISAAPDIDFTGNNGTVGSTLRADALDDAKDIINSLGEIWGVDLRLMAICTLKDAESYLLSKLLDTLRYYRRTLPFSSDSSIESFKGLLKNPLELKSHLQVSLLSLLVEYIEWCPDNEIPIRTPPMLYKYLQPFIKVLMFSPVNGTKDLAYRLAMAAVFSTGAFDRNLHEIEAWFLFLPGYHRKKSAVNIMEVDVLQSLTFFVISFLCDAVSTLGNNLVKYWNILKNYVHCLKGGKDLSPDFSPFIICVLEKCLKVIRSKSGTCSLPKKSMVLLYTCNTVKYLLQTQVNAGLLSALVNADLTEKLSGNYEYDEVFPKWTPLKNLLNFVESISHQRSCCLFYENEESVPLDGSLGSALGDVNRSLSSRAGNEMAETTMAFISSIIFEDTDKTSTELPSCVVISRGLLGAPFSLLSSVFFLDYNVLLHASKLWPVMFYAGLDMAVSDLASDSRDAVPTGTSNLTLCPDSLTCNQLLDASEADAVAFSIFIKQTPFHVMFPAIMCMNGPYISKLSKMQELLLHKLSESTNDCSLLSNLQLVLFWTHQIQLCYQVNPLPEIEQLLNLCVNLVGNLLGRLFVPESGSDRSMNSVFFSSSHNIQEVIKTIFCHPSVSKSLSFSLGSSQNFSDGNIGNSFDMLNVLSRKGFHKFGNPILNILTMTLDYMWSLFGAHFCVSKAQDVANNFVKTFKGLQQKLFLDVRNRYELCICTKDMMPLLPTLYALHAMHRFLSPFQLLELVDWMFSRVEMDDLPTRVPSLSVGCSLAADAFSALSIYFQQSTGNRVPYDLFWEMDKKNMDADIFEQIYSKVVDFSVNFEIDCADSCLCEVVNALYKQRHMQHETFHPLLLVMWKIIVITPVKVLSHCVHKVNAKKAKFLHILIELSSLHSSLFGHLFLGLVNRSSHHDIDVSRHASDLTLSDDQLMLLLPASLSYLSLISKRLGEQNHKDFKHLAYFYSKILLKGFSHWKSFLSKDIFEEEYGEFFPSSVQELLCLIDRSLLGKSIQMLQCHFALDGDSVKLKKRLKLVKSICPKFASHDELLDCDSQVIDNYSLHQSLNIINRVVAKISLCKILLFHEEAGGDLKDVAVEMQSKLEASKIHFINILVDIWQFIVKKFSLASDQTGTGKSANISLLYNHLEVFVLKNILELAVEMQNDLIQLQSIPFIEQLIRSALLYRFDDPMTMKTLRVILTQLNEGRLSYDLHLQLLLAHSQFAPTLHSLHKPAGSFLKPVSSILKCLVIPSLDHYQNDEKHKELTTELSRGPLEIVKLLWILWTKARQTGSGSGNDIGINLKELHALLRNSYGATLSQIDLVIYNLMQQIEAVIGSWSPNVELNSEAIEEWTRSQHRDNFPIDPDICVSTVLYFPYDRSISDELPSVNKIEMDYVRKKICSSHVEVRERYDPLFILQFSIHSLSKAYIEPVEFAGSGLLAIAFVSMSSPDHGIRILAYGALDKFKNALEKCQKRKDVMGLRLLLNSVQNSIEEPWQRIPSVIALFAAEASCVLLDSSHDHYAAISTLLIHSSKLSMRVIPLFDNFFWSTSVNFKAERFWMLRLVYAGLNSDDDAMIYIRNSILENLMSFYVSPLSDVESKDLIIEVIKKSVKLHKIARHLVKHGSLFSWFSSLISVTRERLHRDENRFFLKHVLVVLKVVNDVISFGSISKWLQNYGLEQLMELSSRVFNFLLHDVTLANETVGLVNPFLQLIASVLKLSQKRKIYQPHFTLSIEGLYQIYQVGSLYNQATKSINPEFALEAILMNAPPDTIFLMWAELTYCKDTILSYHHTVQGYGALLKLTRLGDV